MSINVQRALTGDAEVIARFNQHMALETEDKTLIWDSILSGVETMLGDESLGFYLVARDDQDHVCGCLGVTFEWSDWRNGLFWWIQSVYVAPESRQHGVFTAMYETVKNEARQHDQVCGIRLYVEKENKTAQQTYLKLGMHEEDYRIMEEVF